MKGEATIRTQWIWKAMKNTWFNWQAMKAKFLSAMHHWQARVSKYAKLNARWSLECLEAAGIMEMVTVDEACWSLKHVCFEKQNRACLGLFRLFSSAREVVLENRNSLTALEPVRGYMFMRAADGSLISSSGIVMKTDIISLAEVET